MLFASIVLEAILNSVSAAAPQPLFENNNACCKTLIPNTFPLPITVKTEDMLIAGRISVEYMKRLIRCNKRNPRKCFSATIIENNECKNKLMCYETYCEIMMSLIKCFAGVNTSDCSYERTKEVIRCIYDAAKKQCASNGQLIIFSALALHNMNLLVNFTCPNYSNVCLDGVPRGLMQIQTTEYYQWLATHGCSSKKCKYIQCPAILDEFTCETIYDEFALYLANFDSFKACCNKCSGSNGIKDKNMDVTLDKMRPADYLNSLVGNGCQNKCLQSMFERRMKIFEKLKSLVAKYVGPFCL